ncbi:hypothetical protein [Nicoliella lavandulae]|uniref:Uncharacterized protein n=1 Tax=Nicoliella lavandulae TaxID=3082954 RepID=A0ABU8SM89_9LACO
MPKISNYIASIPSFTPLEKEIAKASCGIIESALSKISDDDVLNDININLHFDSKEDLLKYVNLLSKVAMSGGDNHDQPSH